MDRLRAFLLERFTIAIAGAVVATALFVVVAHQVAEGGTRRVDAEVVAFWAARQTPLLHTAMQGVSLLASGAAQTLIGLGCVWAAWRRPPFRPDALGMLVAIVGGEIS